MRKGRGGKEKDVWGRLHNGRESQLCCCVHQAQRCSGPKGGGGGEGGHMAWTCQDPATAH